MEFTGSVCWSVVECLLEFTWVAKRDLDLDRLEATNLLGLGLVLGKLAGPGGGLAPGHQVTGTQTSFWLLG